MPQTSRSTTPPARPNRTWWIAGATVLILVAAALVYFFAIYPKAQASGPTMTPTPVENLSAIDAYVIFPDENVHFVDIRPATEYKAYHIDRTTNIPYDQLSSRMNEIPRTGTIVILDNIGGEPAINARAMLKQAGYPDVVWVLGGMHAWVNAGLPYMGTAPY